MSSAHILSMDKPALCRIFSSSDAHHPGKQFSFQAMLSSVIAPGENRRHRLVPSVQVVRFSQSLSDLATSSSIKCVCVLPKNKRIKVQNHSRSWIQNSWISVFSGQHHNMSVGNHGPSWNLLCYWSGTLPQQMRRRDGINTREDPALNGLH